MRALLCCRPCLNQVLVARACFHSRITWASISVSKPTAYPPVLVSSLLDQSCLTSSVFETYQPLVLRSQRARLSVKNLHGIRSLKTAESISRSMLDLCDQDESLVNLFLAASSHQWQILPGKLSALADMHPSAPATMVMTGLQSLEELAMSTTAVLRKCEAA